MQPSEGRMELSFVMIEEAMVDGNTGGGVRGWLPCLPHLFSASEAPAASTLVIDSGAGRRLRRRRWLRLCRRQRMGLLFQGYEQVE
jgi:hypothetical protein